MYQAGAGVAHLKEQYIVKTNGNSSSSSSSSSALSSSSSSTISFSSPNDNHGEAAPSRGLIRGRTKQQLGLVDVKKNNWKNSGKNFDDISNVLQRELMKRLKKHQYYFLPGTEESGNRYGKKNDRSKKKEKKRTAPPMHCYQFLKNGSCNFGDECKYKHLTQQQLAEIDERTKNVQEISIKDNDATTSEAVITTDTCTSTTPSTTSDNTAAVDATKPDSVVVPSATPNLTPTTAVTTTTSAVAAPTKIFNERKTIDFHHKIYVAPLTTVGNLPFRRIMKDFGTDITCGEMALATNLLKANSSEWSLVRRHKCEDVFGIQVAGGDHRLMDRLSQVIENELDVDFVDLNMGCPLDFICGKGMGSKLMLRVNRVKNIVQSMTSRLSVPMTLKLRTGWSKTSPMAHSFLEKIPLWNMELCKNRTGGPAIQAVTIHGRSRLQRYKHLADWDFIRTCSNNQLSKCNELASATTTSSIPRAAVIGNGDVYSFTDWNRELESGELDTCMLARGALIKPWLPKEIKEQRHWDISATERLDILKDYVKYGLEYWGSDDSGVSRCRRFLLEWQSFLHRYIPVGLLERVPHQMNERPPRFIGRNDLETMLASNDCRDWIALTTMAGLPPPKPDYHFTPKHRANAYSDEHKKQLDAISVLQQNEGGQLQEDGPPSFKKQKIVHDPASK